MKRVAYLLSIISIFLIASVVSANPPQRSDQFFVAEARQGLSEILALWRNEMFEELYLHTVPSGKQGRYHFLERMVNSLRKPACCWQQLQDVEAAYVSPDRVILIATVGMELDGAGIEFSRQSFNLTRVGGIWKVPTAEIITLADAFGYRAIPREIIEKTLP
ncbi:MAG TPA: hypothetical protein VJ161_09065 [Geobacteraceae bacterium]|nr:hypothetical protein [Geobacteraceae bacterium]